MIRFIFELITAYIDERLSKWENKRKGHESHEFCENCIYTHEYRTDDRMVYIRCKSCLHVTKKRPMTGKELVDMLRYEEQEASALEPDERNGGHHIMVNDGSKYMNNKERERKINYCKSAFQFHHDGTVVIFESLPDCDLQKYYLELAKKESQRKRHIRFCEDMTQFYRTDKHVQFQLLHAKELEGYVEMYTYDQEVVTCLDEGGA